MIRIVTTIDEYGIKRYNVDHYETTMSKRRYSIKKLQEENDFLREEVKRLSEKLKIMNDFP